MDNIELHLYLRLDRRWEFECHVRVNTSQREQYGGTVHLFIGTGHNLWDITFMSFTKDYNYDTGSHGSIGHFIFKSVHSFILRHEASALLLRGSAKGVSSYRIFGDEAYPQQHPYLLTLLWFFLYLSYLDLILPFVVILWLLLSFPL